jgi:hypothetical protein
MSTSRYCAFIEAAPGEWYMELAANEYDDAEDGFDTFGPFASEDAVDAFLSDNFSNPGGMSIMHHDDPWTTPAKVAAVRAAAIHVPARPASRFDTSPSLNRFRI